jgi:hypothetical protein
MSGRARLCGFQALVAHVREGRLAAACSNGAHKASSTVLPCIP